MNDKSRQLLQACSHLLKNHELMAARWLLEEWDGRTQKLPSWLRDKIWTFYPAHALRHPDHLAREICLRLLKDHKSEISAKELD